VVASQDEEVLRVLDLVRQEQADGLQGLLASINVVTKEQVICLGWEASVLEQAQEVVVLSVNIAANLYRRLELEQDRLGDEDLASLSAQVSYLSFQQLNLLSWSRATDFEQTVDDGVQVHIVLVRHCVRHRRGSGDVKMWSLLSASRAGAPEIVHVV